MPATAVASPPIWLPAQAMSSASRASVPRDASADDDPLKVQAVALLPDPMPSVTMPASVDATPSTPSAVDEARLSATSACVPTPASDSAIDSNPRPQPCEPNQDPPLNS